MVGKPRKFPWSAAVIVADVIALGALGLLLWPFPISFHWHWSKADSAGTLTKIVSDAAMGVSIDPQAVAGAPDSITAVCADRNADVWCGTSGQGLWRLGVRDGQWTHIAPAGDSASTGLTTGGSTGSALSAAEELAKGGSTVPALSAAEGFTAGGATGLTAGGSTAPAIGGVTSLALDAAGRMWVGTDSAGVAVFYGQWRQFDLSNAPVGAHVFAIATCPRDNDIWIASDLALARYSFKNNTWSSFDRTSNTLPAWPVSCMAFDASGNLLAGTPADGLLLASASSGYSTWRHVTGPETMPTKPVGDGLPSSEINAVLAVRDGTLYAGTPFGLAMSGDGGATWTHLRGADLGTHIDQSYLKFGVRPPPRTPAAAATVVTWPCRPLLADWVSTLAQDTAGHIWVGYRGAGYECRSSDVVSGSVPRPSTGGPRYISSIVNISSAGGATMLVSGSDGMTGTCGLESVRGTWPTTQPTQLANTVTKAAVAPLPAGVPSVAELNAMRQKVLGLPKPSANTSATAEYIGDDWTTGGDWPGRYGRCLIFRAGNPTRKMAEAGDYDMTQLTGPFIRNANVGNGNMPGDVAVDANWLYGGRGNRRLGWIDDGTTGHSENPPTMQGPDLYVGVRVPEGSHAISLYFYTGRDPRDDGSAGQRDYLIEIKRGADLNPSSQWNGNSSQQLVPIELAPALATARVNGFADCGVYERFAIHGRGIWWVKISRNFSDSTRLEGVFIDKLGGDEPAGKAPGLNNAPPVLAMPADAEHASDPGAAAAYALWAALDAAKASPGYAAVELPYRAAAYRAAAAAGVSDDWLANWRAELHAYSDRDKSAFRTAMGLAVKPAGSTP